MGKIRTLNHLNDGDIFLSTKTSAVSDNEGVTLDALLDKKAEINDASSSDKTTYSSKQIEKIIHIKWEEI